MGPQCHPNGGTGLSGVTSTPPKMGQEPRPQGWESRPGGRLRACGSTMRSIFAIQNVLRTKVRELSQPEPVQEAPFCKFDKKKVITLDFGPNGPRLVRTSL